MSTDLVSLETLFPAFEVHRNACQRSLVVRYIALSVVLSTAALLVRFGNGGDPRTAFVRGVVRAASATTAEVDTETGRITIDLSRLGDSTRPLLMQGAVIEAVGVLTPQGDVLRAVSADEPWQAGVGASGGDLRAAVDRTSPRKDRR